MSSIISSISFQQSLYSIFKIWILCIILKPQRFKMEILWLLVVCNQQSINLLIQNVKSFQDLVWTKSRKNMILLSMDNFCMSWKGMIEFKIYFWTSVKCLIYIKINEKIPWTFKNENFCLRCQKEVHLYFFHVVIQKSNFNSRYIPTIVLHCKIDLVCWTLRFIW